MRNTKWLVGLLLVWASVGVSMAVEAVPLREPVDGARELSAAHDQGQRKQQEAQGAAERAVLKTQQAQNAPQGKTREQVKRELAAARASGCMDVSDTQYPQPCPLPDGTRSVAEAFLTQ